MSSYLFCLFQVGLQWTLPRILLPSVSGALQSLLWAVWVFSQWHVHCTDQPHVCLCWKSPGMVRKFRAELSNTFRAIQKWKCKTQKLPVETRLHTNIIASAGKCKYNSRLWKRSCDEVLLWECPTCITWDLMFAYFCVNVKRPGRRALLNRGLLSLVPFPRIASIVFL